MSSIPKSPLSYWVETGPGPHYAHLQGDLEVDVAIVGGGITGITAALLLQRAGKRVAVLEGRRVGQGVTGYTTAHLTEAIDARYATIERDFGLEGAKLAADASRSAIARIARFVAEEKIDCAFRTLPGYLYSEDESDIELLHAEFEAAKRAGLRVEMTREVPLPFATAAALRFEGQAELHSLDYLFPLCQLFLAAGGTIFETAQVLDVVDGEPCAIHTEAGTVRAADVIVAANAPINRLFLQTKIAHYRSYVIAVRVAEPRLEGLFWDTDDPYHYLRGVTSTRHGGNVVLVGGEDHKTGIETDTEDCYERLLAYTRLRFHVEEVGFRWSAQVIEPVDGLPFIGRNSLSTHVYVATGYSGNGMTFGTAAAMMLADEVLGRQNAWSELFAATRVKPLAAAKDYVTENVDFPLHLVGDRVRPAEAKSLKEVGRGEGKIANVDGTRLAVYRDDAGVVHALSPVCPHLGCHVHFNSAERSWDCPCHGSRFKPTGEVINGPSTRGLEVRKVDDDRGDEPDLLLVGPIV